MQAVIGFKEVINLVYFWLHVHFFVEKTCWAGNRAEIRNSLQQNTRWGAEPRKKAFSSTLFQQIQIFGKQSFQRKSSEMLRANKIFAKGV